MCQGHSPDRLKVSGVSADLAIKIQAEETFAAPGQDHRPTFRTGIKPHRPHMTRGISLMRKLTKKTIAVAAASAVILSGAGVAYAYWTTTGSGSGQATSASSNGNIVLNASFAGGLTPGASRTVSYTADNANSSSLFVGTITPTVSIDAAHSSCAVADFTIPATAANTTVPASTNGFAVGTGTLTFADTSANQDACKGAIVTLTLASN